jgi:hypothetical protein
MLPLADEVEDAQRERLVLAGVGVANEGDGAEERVVRHGADVVMRADVMMRKNVSYALKKAFTFYLFT